MAKSLTFENAKVGFLVRWEGWPSLGIKPIFGVITKIYEQPKLSGCSWSWGVSIIDSVSGLEIEIDLTDGEMLFNIIKE